MEHVHKKLKVESSDKENNGDTMDLKGLIARGEIMQYAAARETVSSSGSIQSYSSHFASEDPRAKKPWEYRIPEVLDMHLEHKKNIEGAKKTNAPRKMEGDIPNLCLHSSFFVEGIRIGWPFPVIMPPQRQVCVIDVNVSSVAYMVAWCVSLFLANLIRWPCT